jgi:branched-subunit amino acid ABC-type transport system permease component
MEINGIAANGGIKGSLTGISVGVGITSMQKVWRSLQAFGDIAFAYSFSNILIEIQVIKPNHRTQQCSAQFRWLCSLLLWLTTYIYITRTRSGRRRRRRRR